MEKTLCLYTHKIEQILVAQKLEQNFQFYIYAEDKLSAKVFLQNLALLKQNQASASIVITRLQLWLKAKDATYLLTPWKSISPLFLSKAKKALCIVETDSLVEAEQAVTAGFNFIFFKFKLPKTLVKIQVLNDRLAKLNLSSQNIIVNYQANYHAWLTIKPNLYAGFVLKERHNNALTLSNILKIPQLYLVQILQKMQINFIALKVIAGGFSNNLIAKFKTPKGLFLIKIYFKIDKMLAEAKALKAQNVPIQKLGSALVRPYFEAQTVCLLNEVQIKSLIHKIEGLHHGQLFSRQQFDYDAYDDYISSKIKSKYLSIKKQLQRLPLVQIHGDINRKNFLVNANSITLIDFEWAKLGPAIIDYAYLALFVPETYPYVKHLPFLSDAIFFIKWHTIGWCYQENSLRAQKLLNSLLKLKN